MISRVANSSSTRWMLAAFCLCVALNMALWFHLRPLRPNLGIVPELPSPHMVKLLSFGDSELYFRIAAYRLENAGDTFGRVTPYRDYDYAKLEKWFLLLDDLDSLSDATPAMAGYLFSQSQEAKRDVPYIIRYLEQHYDRNPTKKWWWLSHATYLANTRLKDKDLALRLAYKLGQTPADVPLWVRQMPAFIYEEMGEKEQAFTIIENILRTQKDIPENDLRFMNIFIQDRLGMMKGADQPTQKIIENNR